MTDIKQLLRDAGDVPVTVDVQGDLARGRAAARRGRVRVASVVTGAALVTGVVVVGVPALGGDDSRAGRYAAPSATPTADPTDAATTAPTSDPTREPETITATPADPASLVHTPFYDVPPPPPGWYVVGGEESFAMIAREGTTPSLRGGYLGTMTVMLSPAVAGWPDADWAAYDFDGRTFYLGDGGANHLQLRTERGDGQWLTLQYPGSAGFALPDLVVLLAGVEVLPGAVGAS